MGKTASSLVNWISCYVIILDNFVGNIISSNNTLLCGVYGDGVFVCKNLIEIICVVIGIYDGVLLIFNACNGEALLVVGNAPGVV